MTNAAGTTTLPSGVRQGSRVVIIGGGPGGYEAAMVAVRLGAHVTLISDQGVGGAAVLSDVVPSKALIATSDWLSSVEFGSQLGITGLNPQVDLQATNRRVMALAAEQSEDIYRALLDLGVNVVFGRATLLPETGRDSVRAVQCEDEIFLAEYVLLATGARPRELPGSPFDGDRILNWKQLYDLDHVPQKLIVVGSGVTGAEFACAYLILGSQVTLVSSRDHLLPGQDRDAADLVEGIFRRRGMQICPRSRAAAVRNCGDSVQVDLTDGTSLEGSHCLIAVGALPNTDDLGLASAGVEVTDSGHIRVDRVSRTTAWRVYAAGDCTGILPLASVAAQQGRIAMDHALGDSVDTLSVGRIAQTVFTSPQVATVGISEDAAAAAGTPIRKVLLPLSRNPRAKMQGMRDGFVKLLVSQEDGTVLGAVIVSQRASDMIFGLTLAVNQRLTVDDLAATTTVYPSLSGSLAEAARMLHSPQHQ